MRFCMTVVQFPGPPAFFVSSWFPEVVTRLVGPTASHQFHCQARLDQIMQPQAEAKHSMLLAVQRLLCMQVRLQGPRLLSSASPDSVVKYLIGALLRMKASAVNEE